MIQNNFKQCQYKFAELSYRIAEQYSSHFTTAFRYLLSHSNGQTFYYHHLLQSEINRI